MRLPERILLLSMLLFLGACGDPGTGPVDVKWDRTTCERCRMILSDRRHAAQVRVPTPDGGSKVYAFDDLGCAVIWLERQPARADSATEIWVTDWRSGDWIDARTAHYVPDQSTPMAYGLGAQIEPGAGTLDYAQAREHIFEVERKFNVHGGHLDAEPPLPQSGQ